MLGPYSSPKQKRLDAFKLAVDVNIFDPQSSTFRPSDPTIEVEPQPKKKVLSTRRATHRAESEPSPFAVALPFKGRRTARPFSAKVGSTNFVRENMNTNKKRVRPLSSPPSKRRPVSKNTAKIASTTDLQSNWTQGYSQASSNPYINLMQRNFNRSMARQTEKIRGISLSSQLREMKRLKVKGRFE